MRVICVGAMPSGHSLHLLVLISLWRRYRSGREAQSAPWCKSKHLAQWNSAYLSPAVRHRLIKMNVLLKCMRSQQPRACVCSHSTSVLLRCSAVDRPGVLVLEVLEVMEECGMRAARCERHRPPGGTEESAPVLVLFSRETVAHLMPAPKDTIHIYPPW